MNYIVLDLEWNQPLSYHSVAYKSVGGKLIFEMLQFGAIKLNENCEIIDTFNQLIQPTHYLKLHPRIQRITQISEEDLYNAPQFPKAFRLFEDWCGEDYAILTWGCDDISVLQQNIDFFECDSQLGSFYDMQSLFGTLIGNFKERKALKSAMEYFEIDPDESKAFHNALNDAYYTALVFTHFPDKAKVLEHPLQAKKLIHTDRKKKAVQTTHKAARSNSASLVLSAAQHPPCPICGKKQNLAAGYVLTAKDHYAALAICEEHGLIMVKIKITKDQDDKRTMERTVGLTEEQSKAYVSTKILQWQNKLAAQSRKRTKE